MGIIDLIFLPLSVIFAIISIAANKKKSDLFALLSFVFCAILPIGSVFDINARIHKDDIAGIMDIYPTLGVAFLLVLILVTALNITRLVKQNRK